MQMLPGHRSSSWDNKHPADKQQGEEQAGRQVSRYCVWTRPLKRFHQRAVGARRDLAATGRSYVSGGEVVRTLSSRVRAHYIEKERKRDVPTLAKKAAMTSMQLVGRGGGKVDTGEFE